MRYCVRLSRANALVGWAAAITSAALLVAISVLVGQVIGLLPQVLEAGPDSRFIGLLIALLSLLTAPNLVGLVSKVTGTQLVSLAERESTLSKTMPGGTDLSGGKWQRIALARALRAVEVGATVLVLDEPAAALDAQAEARLVDGYLDLARDVTSMIISHRFSVVRPVPTICVLEHGRIVETGSHPELMAFGGRYATMFSLQASRYADSAADSDGPL